MSRAQGHFEAQFTDGHAGVGFFDKSFDTVVRVLARQDRPIKNIAWVSDMDAYNAQKLAERLYNMIDPWDRDYETVDDLANDIKNDPCAVIEYLIDLVDDLR